MSKLFIILVGLPARGKSTVASRLMDGFTAEGIAAKVFNNGDIRRLRLGEESSKPEFYHPENSEGRKQREAIAFDNLAAAKYYLEHEDGEIAILDATNVSRSRRVLIEQQICGIPFLYIECINDDPELVAASVRRKTRLPEFSRMTEENAVKSFMERMEYYERIYSPLESECCFIRVDTLRNIILHEQGVEHIPYYICVRDILVSDWVKQLFLVRHGESVFNTESRIGGDSSLTERGRLQAATLAEYFSGKRIPYIFTSQRRRSIETATPITIAHPEATVIALPELDEINAGVCDGMCYDDIKRMYPEEYAARSKDKYHYTYPQGEGYCSMRERVERGFRKALFLSGGQPGIVLIGHQAVNRMILSLFLFRRTEDVPYIYIPQTQFFQIEATHRRKLFELVRFMPRD